jgi:hypothetical protein
MERQKKKNKGRNGRLKTGLQCQKLSLQIILQ